MAVRSSCFFCVAFGGSKRAGPKSACNSLHRSELHLQKRPGRQKKARHTKNVKNLVFLHSRRDSNL